MTIFRRSMNGPEAHALVNTECNRRIRAGFFFAGKPYDYDEVSQARIAGASTAALGAKMNGAQPGDLRWRWPDRDFQWIAADNSLTPMDAQTCFRFGEAALDHEAAHVFAARMLKTAAALPADWRDDPYWPGGAP